MNKDQKIVNRTAKAQWNVRSNFKEEQFQGQKSTVINSQQTDIVKMKQQILDGNQFAKQLTSLLRPRLASPVIKLKPPHLHIINIGNNPSSQSYIKKKTQLAQEIGIRSILHHFELKNEEKFSIKILQDQVLQRIRQLNSEKTQNCSSILLQLPLPSSLNTQRLIQSISPLKDVDCLTQTNRKQMLLNPETSHLHPCTPAAVLRILNHYKIPIQSQKITIIGRSKLVGQPIAYLLMGRNATVTVCHHLTRRVDLEQSARDADILISAVGVPNLIKQVKDGGVVIDIGISRVENLKSQRGYKIVGDVDESVKKKFSRFYTPVPGGVGPLTVAMLMENAVKLWEYQLKKQQNTEKQ